MPEIHHNFVVNQGIEKVFNGVSDPIYLDKWWSKNSSGNPRTGEIYKLGFGPGYAWEAEVTSASKPDLFELKLIKADNDWMGSKVTFELVSLNDKKTQVKFHHSGWQSDSDHFRISNYCWAMYLRILKRYLEYEEEVPYEKRLEV